MWVFFLLLVFFALSRERDIVQNAGAYTLHVGAQSLALEPWGWNTARYGVGGGGGEERMHFVN